MSSREAQRWGISNAQRKKYARNMHVDDLPRKKTTKTTEAVSFSDADLEGVQVTHDDVVVITVKVGDFIVQRMFVDNCSGSDVLFFFAFRQMEIDMIKLEASLDLLMESISHEAQILGSINLLMVIEEEPKMLTMMVKFLVIEFSFAYKGIIE